MQKNIIGWDIGGAHLKAALLNEHGGVIQVVQLPCPLWKGLDYLRQAVTAALQLLPVCDYRHAVTMTGELADCFSSREQGVMAIIQTLQDLLKSQELRIFAGTQGFIAADKVQAEQHMAIASANWLASAQCAAQHCKQGLFVDIGSSTTDILLLEKHRLQAVGFTDYQRLVSGELLYTGVVRTAVMALAQQAEFNGQTMGLMAEYFATTADVYRVVGDLQEAHDQSETADGAEKTPQASARRLSRLTGYEFNLNDWPLWLQFAKHLKQRQQQLIRQACQRQIQRSTTSEPLSLVGAGVGRFLLAEIARQLGLNYLDFNQFFQQPIMVGNVDSADCAPAVAVAYLAGEFCESRSLV